MGDANRLQQIVWNLVNNAVKFTPGGGRIAVSVAREGESVQIRVTDTGEGIDREFLPHVFDRFRQADSTSTRRFGGLGLGLAIVRQLTEMHGGSVAVTSQGLGHGTTFTVTLPVAQIAADADTPHARDDAMADLSSVDVVLAEDDEQTRRFIVAALERSGATVRDYDSAAGALAAMRDRPPSILISDIAMPGRDGYSLIADVRASSPTAAVPAIAITAFGGADDRSRILAAGFQHYLLKPIDPLELTRTVADLVEGS